jgi:hypothetical protein
MATGARPVYAFLQQTQPRSLLLSFEDARLFREGVHALARRRGWLLLQLQVQGTSKLEGARLLQLLRRNGYDAFHDGLHILLLQASRLRNATVRSRGCHHAARLHSLHRLHWSHDGRIDG